MCQDSKSSKFLVISVLAKQVDDSWPLYLQKKKLDKMQIFQKVKM